MFPDLACGSVRSAADVNAAIRALWSHPQVPLSREQRAEYERLLTEWRRVEGRGVTTAA